MNLGFGMVLCFIDVAKKLKFIENNKSSFFPVYKQINEVELHRLYVSGKVGRLVGGYQLAVLSSLFFVILCLHPN